MIVYAVVVGALLRFCLDAAVLPSKKVVFELVDSSSAV